MKDLGFQFDPEEFYKPKGRLSSRKEKKDPLYFDDFLEGKESEGTVEELPPKAISSFNFLYFSILLMFFILFGRTFQLQVLEGKDYRKKAEVHSLREIILRTPRGLIYDRFFDPQNPQKGILAKSVPKFSFAIVPKDLPQDDAEKKNLFKKISFHLKIDVQQIEDAVSEQKDIFQPAIVKKNISKDEALILEKEFSEIPAVSVFTEPLREYPQGIYFSHIIGYTGRINQAEYGRLKGEGYDLNATIGKGGLESFYEKYLYGQNGKEIVEVDALGNVVKKLGKKEPQAGLNLITTIDSNLQKKTYEVLEKISLKVGSKRAAAVAIDPQNGEVLSMVSLPSFDNNIFNKETAKETQRLFSNPLKPLFNRAISGTYSTGSTIKPIIAAAALSEGIITPFTRIFDRGYISVKNPYIQGIVYTYRCWKTSGHGSLNVIEAIKHSCNVFFYTIGGGYENQRGLGAEKLANWFSKFGLGEKTGIDIDAEVSGLIPTPKWKKEALGEEWYLGDTYHMSIGQGNLLTTPLQAALFTSTIANGGILYKPHFVKKIIDSEGNTVEEFKPQIIRKDFVNKNHLEYSKKGMLLVVQEGTARPLASLKVKVAGKTGTAQLGLKDEKTHSWFIFFAPFENPKIAMAIIIEEGGAGAGAALPAAKEILEWYFR